MVHHQRSGKCQHIDLGGSSNEDNLAYKMLLCCLPSLSSIFCNYRLIMFNLSWHYIAMHWLIVINILRKYSQTAGRTTRMTCPTYSVWDLSAKIPYRYWWCNATKIMEVVVIGWKSYKAINSYQHVFDRPLICLI